MVVFIAVLYCNSSKPCLNGGTCVHGEICKCPSGFDGNYCEKGKMVHSYYNVLRCKYKRLKNIVKKSVYRVHVCTYASMPECKFHEI